MYIPKYTHVRLLCSVQQVTVRRNDARIWMGVVNSNVEPIKGNNNVFLVAVLCVDWFLLWFIHPLIDVYSTVVPLVVGWPQFTICESQFDAAWYQTGTTPEKYCFHPDTVLINIIVCVSNALRIYHVIYCTVNGSSKEAYISNWHKTTKVELANSIAKSFYWKKTQIYVLLWAGNALRIPYIDIVLPTTSLLQYHVVSSCCWIGRRNIALCTVQHAANALRICMGSGNSVWNAFNKGLQHNKNTSILFLVTILYSTVQ